jgi:SAM-dependent methyltransferase
MISDPTTRFSTRVDNYVKFRPAYPAGVLDVLRAQAGLKPDTIVADVGSGTGIFTRQLLASGNTVYGIEPNEKMRAAAAAFLAGFPGYRAIAGTAEATTLPTGAVGLITAAQSFHWFDRTRTRAEFARILTPGGWLALIWNERLLDTTPFLRAYEAALQTYGTDYVAVRHQHLDLDQVRAFVGAGEVTLTTLENRQLLDFAGLQGRVLSSSYAPEPGQAGYEPMLRHLQEIFEQHQSHGQVSLDYETQVYCARLRG